MEGKISPPLENASQDVKSKYKKGEIKAKKIIIDSLKLRRSKEMYDNIVNMYEVNNLSHIRELKNQLKESKFHKG